MSGDELEGSLRLARLCVRIAAPRMMFAQAQCDLWIAASDPMSAERLERQGERLMEWLGKEGERGFSPGGGLSAMAEHPESRVAGSSVAGILWAEGEAIAAAPRIAEKMGRWARENGIAGFAVVSERDSRFEEFASLTDKPMEGLAEERVRAEAERLRMQRQVGSGAPALRGKKSGL